RGSAAARSPSRWTAPRSDASPSSAIRKAPRSGSSSLTPLHSASQPAAATRAAAGDRLRSDRRLRSKPTWARNTAFVRGLEGAVAGARLVNPPGEPRRNKGDHDRHEVDAALVPDDVGVVAVVDEARSSWNDAWRAGGIVAFVKR